MKNIENWDGEKIFEQYQKKESGFYWSWLFQRMRIQWTIIETEMNGKRTNGKKKNEIA